MENFKDTDALSQNLINMKESSKMVNITVKESTHGALETCMKGRIRMEKSTGMEFIRVSMDPFIKVIGKTVKEMEKAWKYLHQEPLKKSFSKWVLKKISQLDID